VVVELARDEEALWEDVEVGRWELLEAEAEWEVVELWAVEELAWVEDVARLEVDDVCDELLELVAREDVEDECEELDVCTELLLLLCELALTGTPVSITVRVTNWVTMSSTVTVT